MCRKTIHRKYLGQDCFGCFFALFGCVVWFGFFSFSLVGVVFGGGPFEAELVFLFQVLVRQLYKSG